MQMSSLFSASWKDELNAGRLTVGRDHSWWATIRAAALLGSLLVALACTSPAVFADTPSELCSKQLSGPTQSLSLSSDCVIPKSDGLSLGSGVEIEGNDHTIYVEGTLEFVGLFTSRLTIKVLEGGSAVINDVQMTPPHLERVLEYQAGSTGSISSSAINGRLDLYAAIPLTDSTIVGFVGVSEADPIIQDNSIESTDTGLSLFRSNAVIANNFIRAEIEVSGNAQPRFTNNLVVDSTFRVANRSGPIIESNRFEMTDGAVFQNVVVNLGSDIRLNAATTIIDNDFCLDDESIAFNLPWLYLYGETSIEIRGNRFPCGPGKGVGLKGTEIEESITLQPVDGLKTFTLTSTVSLVNGAQLTVVGDYQLNSTSFMSLGTNDGAIILDGVSVSEVNFSLGEEGTFDAINSEFFLSEIRNSRDSSGSVRIIDSTIEGSLRAENLKVKRSHVGGSLYATRNSTIADNTMSTYVLGVSAGDNIVIRDNTFEVTNVGVRFEEGSSAVVSGNEFIALDESTVFTLSRNAAPQIVDNHIDLAQSSNSNIGFEFVEPQDAPFQIQRNEICAGSNDITFAVEPSFFDASLPHVVSDNIATCESRGQIRLENDLATNAVIGPVFGITDLAMADTVVVESGATLEILPGMRLNSSRAVDLHVRGQFTATDVLFNNISVIVQSAGQAEITASRFERAPMESARLSFQGGSSGSITASEFHRISVDLEGYVPVTSSHFLNSALYLENTDAWVSNSTFEDSFVSVRDSPDFTIHQNQFRNFSGVSIGSGSGVVEDNAFERSDKALRIDTSGEVQVVRNTFVQNSIAIQWGYSIGTSSLQENTFIDNSLSMLLREEHLFAFALPGFNDSEFQSAKRLNAIWLPREFSASGVLPTFPVPYAASSDVSIFSGASVTIPAGTTIAMSADSELIVEENGELIAIGTEEAPVAFIDNPENEADWRGLVVRSDSVTLRNCVIEGSSQHGLAIENAAPIIERCRIQGNDTDGIVVTGSQFPVLGANSILGNGQDGIKVTLDAMPNDLLVVSDHVISNNGGFGIRNPSSDFNIDAQYNYWGDDSGPLDASDDRGSGGLYNPEGLGQEVSDGVLYDPWLRIKNTIGGTVEILQGSSQSAPLGSLLSIPLSLQVESSLSNPLSGISVSLDQIEGEVLIPGGETQVTDEQGGASFEVRMGLIPGEVRLMPFATDPRNSLTAFDFRGPSQFVLTAQPIDWNIQPGDIGQLGDVSGDGLVNLIDASLISALITGQIEGSELPYPLAADINRDGLTDLGDVYLILGNAIGRFE